MSKIGRNIIDTSVRGVQALTALPQNFADNLIKPITQTIQTVVWVTVVGLLLLVAAVGTGFWFAGRASVHCSQGQVQAQPPSFSSSFNSMQ